jgi:hypothetical protein
VTWLFTGDIDQPNLTLKFGGVGGAIGSIGLGVAALVGAWYLWTSRRPPA